jgi:hypothetical protein
MFAWGARGSKVLGTDARACLQTAFAAGSATRLFFLDWDVGCEEGVGTGRSGSDVRVVAGLSN